jgi:hypothetical protein
MIDSKSRALKERSVLKRQFQFDTDRAFSTLAYTIAESLTGISFRLLQDVPLAL